MRIAATKPAKWKIRMEYSHCFLLGRAQPIANGADRLERHRWGFRFGNTIAFQPAPFG
jgi:hypothetical protein